MDCPKCGTELNKAELTAMQAEPLCAVNHERKLLDGDKSSGVICYGCPKYGYIEMYAQNPKVFKV